MRQLRRPFAELRRIAWRLRHDSLFRTSAQMMAATVVTSGLGYVYWIVAARLYGAEDVGGAVVLVSAMTLASLFSNLGAYSAVVQLLPQRSTPRAWSSTVTAALSLGALAGTIAGAVGLAVLLLGGKNGSSVNWTAPGMAVFVLGVSLATMSMILDYVWIAERAAGRMLFFQTVFAVLKLPLLAVPALTALGAGGIYGSWVAGLIIAIFGALIVLHRIRGFRPVFRGLLQELRSMRHVLAGNHVINLGNMAPVFAVPLIVPHRLSLTETAYFYAAWRIGGFFFMFASSVGVSLLAEGSHQAQDLLDKAWSGFKIVVQLLVPATLAVVVFGPTLLGLFGAGYRDHAFGLLVILTVAAAPDAVTNIYQNVLRVQHRYRLAASISWGMAVIKVGLAWALMPSLGIAGAGWAWLIAQMLGSAVAFADARRQSGAVRAEEPSEPTEPVEATEDGRALPPELQSSPAAAPSAGRD